MNNFIKALGVVLALVAIPFAVYFYFDFKKTVDCSSLKKAASNDGVASYVTDWYNHFSEGLINEPSSYGFLTGSAQVSSLVSPERFERLGFDLSVIGFGSEVESIISINRDISLWDKDIESRDIESISLMSAAGWLIFDIGQPGNLGTIFWRDITEDLEKLNETTFVYCDATEYR